MDGTQGSSSEGQQCSQPAQAGPGSTGRHGGTRAKGWPQSLVGLSSPCLRLRASPRALLGPQGATPSSERVQAEPKRSERGWRGCASLFQPRCCDEGLWVQQDEAAVLPRDTVAVGILRAPSGVSKTPGRTALAASHAAARGRDVPQIAARAQQQEPRAWLWRLSPHHDLPATPKFPTSRAQHPRAPRAPWGVAAPQQRPLLPAPGAPVLAPLALFPPL